MKKSWWKTLLTKLQPIDWSTGTVRLHINTKATDQRLKALVVVDGVEVDVPALMKELEMSKKNVSINSRRRDRLRVDHPEIYQKYFTKKGLKNEL